MIHVDVWRRDIEYNYRFNDFVLFHVSESNKAHMARRVNLATQGCSSQGDVRE